ncbi:MAG: hypothetical protein GF355_08230, partial [Candidatus Eisenbacteria bacterium]|nr:hypothetical protein [Candidatus Eisenbacteria bacterium]
DYMILKFAEDTGELIWSAGYDGPPGWYDAATCIAEGPNGEVIVSGYSDGTGTSWDLATVAFDPILGKQLWVERFDAGDSQTDEAKDLAVSSQGDLYVVGYGYLAATSSDMLGLRYDVGSAAGVNGPAAPAIAMAARPNPFQRNVDIAFELPRATTLQAGIFDGAGRRLAVLHDGLLTPGRHRLHWDGRGPGGALLPAGVYLVRITTPAAQSAQKVILAR